MTSPSLAEIFKIDERHFQNDMSKLSATYHGLDLSQLPRIKDSNTYVGIEVEMEQIYTSIPSGPWQGLWAVRGDGSLRESGVEAVSVPVQGNWIKIALATLFKVIPRAHFSYRTSIHIHLDVRKLTTKQLTNIILVYLSVESLLYKFVGKDRHENIYCVPLYTTGLVNSLVDLINKSLSKQNFENQRYAGLNLDAIKKFGSIEFRHLHGTHDINKIINWINLIFRIYQYALAHPLDVLIKKISDLNTNSLYIAYLNDVFGDDVTLLNTNDVKTDLEKGVKAVKQSIINNKFITELKREFSKTSPAAKLYLQMNKNVHNIQRYFMENI